MNILGKKETNLNSQLDLFWDVRVHLFSSRC